MFNLTSSPVYVGGSRHLSAGSPAAAALVQFCTGLAHGGTSLHVGCASGADALALSIIPAKQITVFAQFSESGQGVISTSNYQGVRQVWWSGARVAWQAGGSVDTVPVKARLIQRSIAAFAGCGVAAFFAPGEGSLSVARHALAAGLPVLIWSQSGAGFKKLAGSQPARLIQCCGLSFWHHQPQQSNFF